MTRECIFCGGRPTTSEHIVPEWAAKVIYQDPRHRPANKDHYTVAQSGVSRSWLPKKDVIEFEAKCVCGPCNNRWMSDIESKAQGMLTEMIRGNQVEIAPGDAAIGKWLCLKAIIHRYSTSPPSSVGQRVLDYFNRYHEPPPTWYAWIARYQGTRGVAWMHSARFIDPSELTSTLILGYLAAKVCAMSESVAVEPYPDVLIRVWPPPVDHEIRVWPPQKWLDDPLLDYLAQSFPKPG